MTTFEKWNGFIMQLAEVYLPITPQEKERLQAELSVIEKTNSVNLFQTIYDAWHLFKLRGIHTYITGEAKKWFIFYFLDMVRENPIGSELPLQVPSKVNFVTVKK